MEDCDLLRLSLLLPACASRLNRSCRPGRGAGQPCRGQGPTPALTLAGTVHSTATPAAGHAAGAADPSQPCPPGRRCSDGPPRYSTVLLFAVAAWGCSSGWPSWADPPQARRSWRSGSPCSYSCCCFPVPALVLGQAPRHAYLATLAGPFFVVWRSWLAIVSRFGWTEPRSHRFAPRALCAAQMR